MNSGNAAPQSGGSGLYRWYMITLLTLAFALNLLDRQIINVLAELIKRDLALADWQLGALTGLSFALLYSVVALPIARFADRSDRVRIIGLATIVWSFFTAACGLAQSFVQLLLMRLGVGIGEAGCAPPSQSLIADTFPLASRARALGVFGFGMPIGAALGLALGGLLAEPLGWRWTMIVAGAPGLVIGLLVLLTLRDPNARARAEAARQSQEPFWGVVRALFARRAFVYLTLGIGLLSFVNVGAMAFSTSFFLRVHEADLAAIGARLSMPPIAIVGVGMGLMGLFGGLGAFVGGALGDRFGVKDVRAYALIPAIGSLFCGLTYIAVFTVPDGGLALLLFGLPFFFSNLWQGPGAVALQGLAGAQSKATVMALVLFATSVLGLGLGPLTIGAMSDIFATTMGSAEGLRLAIVIGVCVGVVSAFFHWMASRALPSELAPTA